MRICRNFLVLQLNKRYIRFSHFNLWNSTSFFKIQNLIFEIQFFLFFEVGKKENFKIQGLIVEFQTFFNFKGYSFNLWI